MELMREQFENVERWINKERKRASIFDKSNLQKWINRGREKEEKEEKDVE